MGRDFAAERAHLVQQVAREGLVSARAAEALGRVPREAFLPPALHGSAYADRALSIGHGQTISAPHMVAIMVSVLGVRPGDCVLEVGTGSGYHAAVLAELARPDGHVVTVEVVPELAEQARAALSATGYDNVEVRTGDGALGAADEAPFDRVSVAAATPAIPAPLTDQLALGGRLVAPLGTRECTLVSLDREPDGLREEAHVRCVFVPLVGTHGVLDRAEG